MIEIKNIHKKYGDTSVLEDVSFSVGQGEIVGFLGQNGAGKTTLMRIVMGYIPSTRGSVVVDGIDVSKDVIKTRAKIGYLPENNPLYLDMKVHEYLKYIAGAKKVQNIDTQIKDVVAKTMLQEKIDFLISDLSKGFKQRVGLAAAMLGDPDILILDEPSSGLDPKQAISMRNLITEIGKKKTVIFSSHIMQEIEAVCDRVVLLKDKTIATDDQLEKVVSSIQGIDSIFVSIDGPREKVKEALSNLDGLEKMLEKDGGFEIGSKNSDQFKKAIGKMCVRNEWTLQEMKSVERKLEDLFLESSK